MSLIIVFMAVIVFYTVEKKNTFTFTNRSDTLVKSEQIRPIFGTVKVSGSCDTSVIFTDIETGETYIIGYITPGISEKIKLQNDKWYTVEGHGDITVRAVEVRIE